MVFGNKILVQYAGYNSEMNCRYGYIIEDCNNVKFGLDDVIHSNVIDCLKRGRVISYLEGSIFHSFKKEEVEFNYVRIDDGILSISDLESSTEKGGK